MESLIENLVKKFGPDNFKKIQSAHIGIAGAGGLGSNCALNLVRVGFRRLTLVDFDVVSAANLDRQFYFADQVGKAKVEALKENLLRINAELDIAALKTKIEADNIRSIFKECDIVAECFDRAESKRMLVEELMRAGKFSVGASGLGGVGSSDEILVHKIKDNLVLIGDLKSDVSAKPPLAPRVSIAAAKQADVILEYVLKSGIMK